MSGLSKREVKRLLLHARLDELKRHHRLCVRASKCQALRAGSDCWICRRFNDVHQELEKINRGFVEDLKKIWNAPLQKWKP
jgi:hypothetical protein